MSTTADSIVTGRDPMTTRREAHHGGDDHRQSRRRLRVIVASTYPPTRCGLATFAANVRRGMLLGDAAAEVDILRVGPAPAGTPVQREVTVSWERGADPAGVAAACSEYDAVLLQHEFGIFDGPSGASVLDFVRRLERPLVTVMHTVLTDPSAEQRHIIEQLAARSARVVVMSQSASARLLERYLVDPIGVRTIPHGADLVVGPGQPRADGPPRVLTWGLLGPGKGIEHGIRAVALLAQRGCPVQYVVSGQTHPNVLAAEGERYRDSLRALARELGVEDLVELDDTYRTWSSLHHLVRSATLVLVPYDTREQVTSGVIVEALAASKPIVATAFPHALEVVDGRSGLVVPHEDPLAIADAIGCIVGSPDLRHRFEAAAFQEGRKYAWPKIGAAYSAVIRAAVRAASSPG